MLQGHAFIKGGRAKDNTRAFYRKKSCHFRESDIITDQNAHLTPSSIKSLEVITGCKDIFFLIILFGMNFKQMCFRIGSNQFSMIKNKTLIIDLIFYLMGNRAANDYAS